MSIEGFLKGSSLVVCAPTSSGKTLVAEAAAAATIARGKRLFYTTPLKALSNQKLRDFRCFPVFSPRLASSLFFRKTCWHLHNLICRKRKTR
jgi:replicative superfamily II helicase